MLSNIEKKTQQKSAFAENLFGTPDLMHEIFAAAFLGISLEFLYQLDEAAQIKPVFMFVDGTRFYKVDELESLKI